jgi:hypothetical protein
MSKGFRLMVSQPQVLLISVVRKQRVRIIEGHFDDKKSSRLNQLKSKRCEGKVYSGVFVCSAHMVRLSLCTASILQIQLFIYCQL